MYHLSNHYRISPDYCQETGRKRGRVEASQVLDRLYVGAYETTASIHQGLERLGVTHIVTVAHDQPPRFPDLYKYSSYPIYDHTNEDIYPILVAASEYIDEVLTSSPSNVVLVHCYAGISRSVSVVCAYLIAHKGLSYMEALEHVRRARHFVCPNSSFRGALKMFSADKHTAHDLSYWTFYDEAFQKLGDMYQNASIVSSDAREILSLFSHCFGIEHPFTRNVFDEITTFDIILDCDLERKTRRRKD